MIEVGGIYKLKKIKDFFGTNTEDEFKVLKISGDTVYCQNVETKELNMFNIKDLIDPEFPDDIYSDFQIVMEKLNNVIRPMNLSFWKDLKEDAMASTAAAVPALSGGGTSGSTGMAALGPAPTGQYGARVNGIPVVGQSVKSMKKKKKKKKNETAFSGVIVEQEEIDNFNIQEVKKYFQQNIQQQEIFNHSLQDTIKIVGKTWTETQSHIGKKPFFLLFKHLDYILETAQGDNKLINNTKIRTDGILGWYYLYNTALFGQNLIQIKLDIANTKDNKKVYFLRQKETVSGTPSNVQEHCHVGRNTVPDNIITENEKNVNSLGLIPGKEYDLTPYFHITLLEQDFLNEELQLVAPADPDIQFGDTYFAHTEQDVFDCLDKMIPGDATGVFLKHKKYDETCELTIEMLDEDLYKLSLEEDTEENSNDWEGKGVMDTDAITKEDAITTIQFLLQDYKVVTNKVDEKVESIINDLLEDFHEEYEQITELIAQQLDRMNFEYANTEDIIYKKEGKYKYLLKFDNENGYLKFKVSQDDNVLYENEWKLEEGQDISPIFQEIESVYERYGI